MTSVQRMIQEYKKHNFEQGSADSRSAGGSIKIIIQTGAGRMPALYLHADILDADAGKTLCVISDAVPVPDELSEDRMNGKMVEGFPSAELGRSVHGTCKKSIQHLSFMDEHGAVTNIWRV